MNAPGTCRPDDDAATKKKPLPGEGSTWRDGAHGHDGVRRLAAHHVVVDGQDQGQCVVACHCSGLVTDIHPLTHEEPFTEWVGGTLTVKTKEQRLYIQTTDTQ